MLVGFIVKGNGRHYYKGDIYDDQMEYYYENNKIWRDIHDAANDGKKFVSSNDIHKILDNHPILELLEYLKIMLGLVTEEIKPVVYIVITTLKYDISQYTDLETLYKIRHLNEDIIELQNELEELKELRNINKE